MRHDNKYSFLTMVNRIARGVSRHYVIMNALDAASHAWILTNFSPKPRDCRSLAGMKSTVFSTKRVLL